MNEPTIALQAQHYLGYWGIGNTQSLQADWERCCPPRSLGPLIRLNSDRPAATGIVGQVAVVQPCAQAGATLQLTPDRLTLMPDHFGRSPLYWLQRDQVIWFSSRLAWLLPLLSEIQVDSAAAYGYSCFSYVPTPLTAIAGIATLPAGVRQIWTRDSQHQQIILASSQAPHSWQEAPEPITDDAIAIGQLQTLLHQAIQSQLADLSHEPVGVFLSGGLDSSIVAALLVRSGVKVRAYTLDFGAAGIPEWPYAEQVAAHLGIPLTKVDATSQSIRRALVPTAQALDQPFGDGVTVPLYLLAEAAAQDVPVIFNGEGGDQLFAGWTNKPLIAAGVYQTAHPQAEPLMQQYLRTFHRLWGYEAQIFQPQMLNQARSLNPEEWLLEALDAEACPALLHRLRRATLMLKGAQNIHPRAVQLAWAHGLEARSPFCFLPLAEWAFQIHSDLHLRGSCEKYILKQAVADWLPPEIVWRTKRGMGVPLTHWCLRELWPDLGRWLNPARLQQQGIWQAHLAERLVSGQLGTIQGRRIGECLWLLLMWQVWQETVLGLSSPPDRWDHPFWLPAPLGRFYCHWRQKS